MFTKIVRKIWSTLALLVLIFVIPARGLAQSVSYPARGLFNGYLGQINILECESTNSATVNLKLTLTDSTGTTLAVQNFALSPFGTVHTILNDLAAISNSYGSYMLELGPGQTALGARLSCRTAFYKNAAAGAGEPFQFAYVLPLRNPQQGELSGIYNSYGLNGDHAPTYNYLSVINSSNALFSGKVEVHNSNGSLYKNISVKNLTPGARVDIALGHDRGEVTGIYLLKPINLTQQYEAFLIRYSPNGGGYNFAFPLRSLPGSCSGQPVQLSSMGNGLTDNWLEIGNPTNTVKSVGVSIRNRFGAQITSQNRNLTPYGIANIFASSVIDPPRTGNVGSARITCANTAEKIIVQSVYYGHSIGILAPEWAYAQQGEMLKPALPGEQLEVPVNTYLRVANWIKLANLGNVVTPVDYRILNQAGAATAAGASSIAKKGTADIGVHSMFASNAIGAAVLWSDTASTSFNGELLRVIPKSDGQIGYIFNVPGISQPKSTLPEVNDGYFPSDSPWYHDISAASVDSQSNAIISWLSAAGGWGQGNVMRIDFSIDVLQADGSAPLLNFTPTDDFWDPDCDLAPVPVPAGGNLEGEDGYTCTSDGDCHLLVVHGPSQKLYEMWRANIVNGTFFGGCLAVWDMTKTYPAAGRGEQCTSADAGGLPIAPLLFTADEVAAGEINHAIRFILPNARIRHQVYVHPATHSTGAASGGVNAPPYGARLRLRADFPLNTLPNEATRTVARAMQKYGIILADGGNIALTAQSDRHTTAKWDTLLNTYDLQAIHVTDFQMIEAGQRMNWTGDCVRE